MTATKRKKEVRYYGVVKIKENAKAIWISNQNKYGWSLGLALSKRTVWLRNIRFATRQQVERAVKGDKVVFIPLKK